VQVVEAEAGDGDDSVLWLEKGKMGREEGGLRKSTAKGGYDDGFGF
jgi:hypothetical protein